MRSYLVFCLKQIYFAGCSPRLKVISVETDVSIRSFSKDEPAKEVKGNSYMYNCTMYLPLLPSLIEVGYDAKDYAN